MMSSLVAFSVILFATLGLVLSIINRVSIKSGEPVSFYSTLSYMGCLVIILLTLLYF